MAEKKKKNPEDFAMPNAEDVDMLKKERAESATRVAKFNETFKPSGNIFADLEAKSGTSRDVKRTREIDALFSKASDRQATTRGQDMEFTSNAGMIDMNRDRTRVMEKQGDQQFKLGEGELGLNRDIFDQGVARYNKYGEPMDKLNVSQKALEVKSIGDEFGYGESNALKSLRPEFLAGENSTFKPAKIYDENDIAFNYVPDEAQPEFDSSAAFPEYLRKKDWQSYSNPAIGALNEGTKSLMRGVDLGLQYLRPVEDVIMGMKPGASARAVARPAVRNKLRRRVIK